MKQERYDGTLARRVLAGMVTDRAVLARVAEKWSGEGLFDMPWANLVGGWCIKHVRDYDRAPNGQLRSLFEAWAVKNTAEEQIVTGVERFLSFVSDEWSQTEQPTSDYLVDLAKQYFNQVRARRIHNDVEACLENRDIDGAMEKMALADKVELGSNGLIKPVQEVEYETWNQAFHPERKKQMVTSYSDGLDRFFGDAFTRDSLIAFMGSDKSGKSFWLLDVALRAVRNRQRVAYFEVGDLMQDEVLLRMGMRVSHRPYYAGTVKVPIKFEKGEDGVVVSVEERVFDVGLTAAEAFGAFRRWCRADMHKDLFRLVCHPIDTVSVDNLRSTLRDWERDEWVPDVVVIDYADILAPPFGVKDPLEQIDTTWKALRRMSQELHCLVVTATQSSAAAYSEKSTTLGRKHFSGRKTKIAHVNGMVGINYTDKDKEKGVCRLNWVVRRSSEFVSRNSVLVAPCLALANPAVLSVF